MKIALATDHAGFDKLKYIKELVSGLGHEYVDFGPKTFDPDDDYPIFMFAAAQAVADKQCDLGIILGGSGQGEAMAANRIHGIRCAVYYGPALPTQAIDQNGNKSDDPLEIIKLSRQHNNANMISLGARFLTDELIKAAVQLWLATSFSEEERHARRIRELDLS